MRMRPVVIGALAALIGFSNPPEVAECQPQPSRPAPDPSPVPSPAPAPGDASRTIDFPSRCAGAFFCQGFDQPLKPKGPEGVSLNANAIGLPTSVLPRIDNGVMRFTILNGGGANSAGQYFVSFSDPTILGPEIMPGEPMFYQWRQFIPSELLRTRYIDGTTGKTTSFKFNILSDSGSSSCTNNEVVAVENDWDELPTPNRASPAMYHACGSFE